MIQSRSPRSGLDQLPGLGAARFGYRGRRISIAADLGARREWIFLAQLSQPLVERWLLPLFGFKRLRPGQQHIEHDSQRVNIGARVYVLHTVLHLGIGLLRTHVPGRPHEMSELGKGFSRHVRRGRLGQPEVDDARHGFAVHFYNQNVCRFQIAMDDGFLMRVLHAFADLNE